MANFVNLPLYVDVFSNNINFEIFYIRTPMSDISYLKLNLIIKSDKMRQGM